MDCWLLFSLFESYISVKDWWALYINWTWRNKFTVTRTDWLFTRPSMKWPSHPIIERLIFRNGHLHFTFPCYHTQGRTRWWGLGFMRIAYKFRNSYPEVFYKNSPSENFQTFLKNIHVESYFNEIRIKNCNWSTPPQKLSRDFSEMLRAAIL